MDKDLEMFNHQSFVAQELKKVIRRANGWADMDNVQCEAIDSVLSSIAAISAGKPEGDIRYCWSIIEGAAQLICRGLLGEREDG